MIDKLMASKSKLLDIDTYDPKNETEKEKFLQELNDYIADKWDQQKNDELGFRPWKRDDCEESCVYMALSNRLFGFGLDLLIHPNHHLFFCLSLHLTQRLMVKPLVRI